MKYLNYKLFVAVALVALGVSCASFKDPDTLAMYIADARDIAELGTTAALLESPGFRDELELTRDSLKALEVLPSENVSFADLLNALSKLPVEQLQSDRGQLYVTGGKILLRRIGRNVDLAGVGAVKPFATAFREGIDAGLAGIK